MSNVIDYIKEYGKYSFTEMPLNEVDSLVLSQLVYMNYAAYVPGMQERNSPVSIRSIYEHPEWEKILDDYWFRDSNKELFTVAAESTRFGTLKLNYYVNVINLESETQFSAMTYVLEDRNVYIAFRGTDATLVGWKEDLNMAFSKPLRSQQLAVEYMEKVAAYIGGDFYMGGHSKGGNLAVYAAMNCSDITRNSLREVFNHDGPGFRPEIRETGKYERVAERIHKFVPRSSVVGMILEDHEDYEIIESRSIGAFQHNVFSWKIKEDKFVRVDGRSGTKMLRDAALNEWILSMTEEEAHSFIDTFYNVVCASQASSIFEFGTDWKKCLTGMIDAAKEVDEETKKAIQKILRSLIDITGEKAAAELAERAAELAGKATELGEKATGLLEKNKGLSEKAAELTLKKKQYKRKLTLANQKRKAKKKEKSRNTEQE